MALERENTSRTEQKGKSVEEYAWLSSGSPLPLPHPNRLSSSSEIAIRILNRYLWLVIALCTVGLALIAYGSFKKGQADALRARQQGINRTLPR